jgi:hypothetical protein
MRPRISRKEAAYLVEILTAQTAELKVVLEGYHRKEREFTLLKNELKYAPAVCETLPKIERARELKKELKTMFWRRFSINEVISTNERLIQKYKAIAKGNTRRGDYKNFNSHLCFPREETALKVLA